MKSRTCMKGKNMWNTTTDAVLWLIGGDRLDNFSRNKIIKIQHEYHSYETHFRDQRQLQESKHAGIFFPPEKMMDDCVDFIAQYSWLVNFKVTNFFRDRVWENAPAEWLEVFKTWSYEDWKGVPYGLTKDSWPDSLKVFITEALKHSIPRERQAYTGPGGKQDSEPYKPVSVAEIHHDIRKGMTEKKLHEVCHLASLVNAVVKDSQAEYIVDVGSGLGYLGQVLHSVYHQYVLGLEGKQSHASGAEKRSRKNYADSPYLQNRTCELYPSLESESNFKIVLSDWLSSLPQTGTQNNDSASLAGTQNNGSSSLEENNLFSDNTKTFTASDSTDLCCNTVTYSIDDENACEQKVILFSKCVSEVKNFNEEQVNLCSDKAKPCNRSTGTSDSIDLFNNTVTDLRINLTLSQQTQILDDSKMTYLPSVCMIGLHCCGDLTPTMLKYFTKMEFIKSLCVVSCCYHRMEYKEEEQRLTNFPLSSSLSQCFSRTKLLHPSFNFTPYSMRLAAQETRARWKSQSSEDHNYHMRNVTYRGILELALSDGPFTLKKTSRKMVHNDDYSSFDRYVTTVSKNVQTSAQESAAEQTDSFQVKMRELYNEYEEYFAYIEPITSLQFLLQPVLECLIYKDRLTWLQEQGFDGHIVPIFDEIVSPRNLALIAIKR